MIERFKGFTEEINKLKLANMSLTEQNSMLTDKLSSTQQTIMQMKQDLENAQKGLPVVSRPESQEKSIEDQEESKMESSMESIEVQPKKKQAADKGGKS